MVLPVPYGFKQEDASCPQAYAVSLHKVYWGAVMRTLEEILKFDSGLSIGESLVDLIANAKTVRTKVDISPRGIVRILTKPDDEDMYTVWQRVKGDVLKADGNVIVWGARDPEILKQFDGDSIAIDMREYVATHRRPA